MKKKLFYSFVTLAIAAAVAFNVNLNIQSKTLGGTVLENVEALGMGEDGSVRCCPDSGDTCNVGGTSVSDYDEC